MHDDDRDNVGLDEFMSGLGVGATSRVQGGGKKKVRKRALDGGGHVVASMPVLFVICIFQVAMTTPHSSSHSKCLSTVFRAYFCLPTQRSFFGVCVYIYVILCAVCLFACLSGFSLPPPSLFARKQLMFAHFWFAFHMFSVCSFVSVCVCTSLFAPYPFC